MDRGTDLMPDLLLDRRPSGKVSARRVATDDELQRSGRSYLSTAGEPDGPLGPEASTDRRS
jgi:hypothetical protein